MPTSSKPRKPSKPTGEPSRTIVKRTIHAEYEHSSYYEFSNEDLRAWADAGYSLEVDSWSDYDETYCSVTVYTDEEIDNPKFLQQHAAYLQKLEQYERKLEQYEVDIAKWHEEDKKEKQHKLDAVEKKERRKLKELIDKYGIPDQ